MNCTITYDPLEKIANGKSVAPGDGIGYDSSKLLIAESPIINTDFIRSRAGRTVRIMAEFEEFPKRMEHLGIRGTFLFFGSARVMYEDQYKGRMAALLEKMELETKNGSGEAAAVRTRVEALEKLKWSTEWMDKTERLAFLLTEWSLTDEGREAGMWCKSNLLSSPAQDPKSLYGCRGPRLGTLSSVVPSSHAGANQQKAFDYTFEQPLVVCTGGGPGFMEAGNKGAYCANGVSMGVHISLPFETQMNPYVTPGLHFRMDYFFTRKFWEVLSSKAMICCPGGMGTCDEMFEVLTLIQCGKCPPMPIVLLGKTFWEDIINWKKLAEYGLISQYEIARICFTDDPQEAFEFIVNAIKKEANCEKALVKH